MGDSKGVASGLPTTMEFYSPPVIASIVTTLLLTVDENGRVAENFKAALTDTRDRARAGRTRGEQDLADLLTVVIGFLDGNEQLFLNAHHHILNLLQGLVGTGEWSPCLAVNRTHILDIARLPSHR
jgi:hypothetical protein